LVYDNVPSPEDIADFLPSSGAHVLITSRFTDWGDWADEVALDVFPQTEAVTFLQTRASKQDEHGARTLVEAVGCLPLLLNQAAAYCKRQNIRFDEYAANVTTLAAAKPPGLPYSRPTAATFDLAMRAAVAQCPAVEDIMAYVAHCSPDRIFMTLLEGAFDDRLQRERAIEVLAEVSLIKHSPVTAEGTEHPKITLSAISLHRAVHADARVRAEANGTLLPAWIRLLRCLKALYPNLGSRLSGYENSIANIDQLIARIDQVESDCNSKSNSLDDANNYFRSRGEELPAQLDAEWTEVSYTANQASQARYLLIGAPYSTTARADALDALGRTIEAAELRKWYGVM
jgi:hypothetical protein